MRETSFDEQQRHDHVTRWLIKDARELSDELLMEPDWYQVADAREWLDELANDGVESSCR
jgi:hypothetical protein